MNNTCKSNYEYYNSGHLHDDNLAIDLVINNKNIITDPGSLCYTSDLSVRNKYRSIDSHFAPRKLGYHLKENAFPFSFKNFLKGKVINVDKDVFFGKISYNNAPLDENGHVVYNKYLKETISFCNGFCDER